VDKEMNDYPKVVDEMVDEAFAKSNPTTFSTIHHSEDQNTRELDWREIDEMIPSFNNF
jgi:hypothetical protein